MYDPSDNEMEHFELLHTIGNQLDKVIYPYVKEGGFIMLGEATKIPLNAGAKLYFPVKQDIECLTQSGH